jgi:phosphohistidine phosphatase
VTAAQKATKPPGKRRNLYLLRHAKSDWKDHGAEDIDRHLNERGRGAAKRIGLWMKQQRIRPNWVICSPAVRTRETLELLRSHVKIPDTQVSIDDAVYLAEVQKLLSILAQCSQEPNDVLIVGHNPGMEELLAYLCGGNLPLSKKGKLMPTATLVHVALPGDWHRLAPNSGKLVRIVRAEDLA